MQIAIHRPAQIGGQITRISTAHASILIDLGHNLPNHKEDRDAYDNPRAIAEITEGCSAILYTHYHGDHIGLFHHVPPGIPQYIGEVARQVVCRKYRQLCFLTDKADKQKYQQALEAASQMHTFHERQPLHFGDITVTPYFVCHSAYDAYMFLIEAGGKRILHTGDFRGHGYLGKGLLPTIRNHIGQVDVLITEGTMLGRQGEIVLTETELSRRAARLMKGNKHVFVHCSSTDMERLASFKNANAGMRPHRPLLADDYQRDILGIFTDTAGRKSSCFDFGKVYTYAEGNPKLDDWMLKNGFTMFIRASDKFHRLLDRLLPRLPEVPLLISSMWEGYICRQDTLNAEYVRLHGRFAKQASLHTSGHATVEVLREVCELARPRLAILPIHREKETDFSAIGIPLPLQEKVVTSDCLLDGIHIEFL